MAARFSMVLALVAAMGLGATAPATAQTGALDTLGSACNANPRFFSFVLTGLEDDTEGLGRLCSCLVTEFSPLADHELTMLTKDIERTSTQGDKDAFGDYRGLELKAKVALEKCMVVEGFSDGANPATQTGDSVGLADMTAFTSACASSEILLMVVGEADGAEDRRTTACGCLVETLKTQISTPDAEVLAKDLDGTATQESRGTYEGYGAVADTAGEAFEACLGELEGAPPAQ